MRLFILLAITICLTATACTKSNNNPKSKTDYIPIISANSPINVTLGQSIVSHVTCGFYAHFADITFLSFDIQENLPGQYAIRAKAFYDNIMYGYSLPVVSTFDTTLTLQTPTIGQYILKFYSFNQLVETDTVLVN
jgi:hypothetical protein